MRNSKVNAITYGAIICALVGVLLFVNRQMASYLNEILFFVVPIPIIVYSVKFGIKQTVVMCVAMLLLTAIISEWTTLMFIVGSIISGLIYAWGVEHGKSGTFLVVSVSIVATIVMYISTFALAEFFGYTTITEDMASIKEIITTFGTSIYSEDQLAQIQSLLNLEFLTQVWLIIIVLCGFLNGVVVHLFSYIILARLKMKLPPMKPISTLKVPLWMKLLTFAGYLADILRYFFGVTQYDKIVLPLITVASLIAFSFGYILITTMLNLTIRNKLTRAAILLAILLLLFKYIPFIGLFDMFSNYRVNLFAQLEKMKNEQENKQS